MPVKIFFCYAHEDEVLLNQLKTQLMPLLRMGLIEMWHDRDIRAGAVWEDEIKKQLNEAQIVLLLVSASFITSEYCYGIEMHNALERHKKNEARVIPIILRHCIWQGILGNIQALPRDGKPVSDLDWGTSDKALFEVAEGLRAAVEELAQKPLNPASQPLAQQIPAPVQQLEPTQPSAAPVFLSAEELATIRKPASKGSGDAANVTFLAQNMITEGLQQDTPSLAQRFFHGEDDVEKIKDIIRVSQQVILWGYTLSSHIPFLKEEIEKGLNRGLQAKVLLIKPSGIALEMAAYRNENPTSPKNESRNRLNKALRANLDRLEEIKKGQPNASFEYKVIDYFAPYTMYIYDPHLPNGSLMVRLSAFNVHNSDRLTYYLRRKDEGSLFLYHVDQFHKAWSKAENWRKGLF